MLPVYDCAVFLRNGVSSVFEIYLALNPRSERQFCDLTILCLCIRILYNRKFLVCMLSNYRYSLYPISKLSLGCWLASFELKQTLSKYPRFKWNNLTAAFFGPSFEIVRCFRPKTLLTERKSRRRSPRSFFCALDHCNKMLLVEEALSRRCPPHCCESHLCAIGNCYCFVFAWRYLCVRCVMTGVLHGCEVNTQCASGVVLHAAHWRMWTKSSKSRK